MSQQQTTVDAISSGTPVSGFLSSRLPTLDCGIFDGTTAVARWLARLKWDFEKIGHDSTNLPYSQVIRTINMQCEGEAAAYLDSIPRLISIVERAEEGMATQENLNDLEAALRERFPARIMDYQTSTSDIDDITQNDGEALLAYYNRILSILHRVGCRDAVPGVILTLPEQAVLQGLIRQFVRGLNDNKLRQQAIMMSAMTATGLRQVYTIVQNARQILREQEIEEKRLADETRSNLLLKLVEQHPGQDVEQVLVQQFGRKNGY